MTNVKKMLLGCYIHLRQRRLRDTPPAKPDKEKLLYPFRPVSYTHLTLPTN